MDKRSDDKRSDDKRSDDKRSDDKRSDDKRSDDKRSDDTQSRETKIEQIIAVLISAEYGLSDGYGFYTKDVEATLRHIAIHILDKINDAPTS